MKLNNVELLKFANEFADISKSILKKYYFLKEMNITKICINPSKTSSNQQCRCPTSIRTKKVLLFVLFSSVRLNELYRKIIPVYDLELLYQLY